MEYKVVADEKSGVVDLPKQTSHWTEDIVFKLFKVRTCVYDGQKILWPFGDHSLKERSAKYDYIISYLDKILAKLDLDEMTWYEQATFTDSNEPIITDHNILRNNAQKRLEDNAEGLFAQILKDERDYWSEMENSVEMDMSEEDTSETLTTVAGFFSNWLCSLRTVLEIFPDDMCEAMYEQLFSDLITVMGLSCFRGGAFAKLTFQYHEQVKGVVQTVYSQPDLLIFNKTGVAQKFGIAVVEVRKDNRMSQAFKKVGGESSSASNVPSSSGSPARVDEDIHDCALLTEDYPYGNIRLLTSEEQRNVAVFLPQLMGEVLGALNSQKTKIKSVALPSKSTRDQFGLKSTIGFGVVGLKVYVVNFVCVRRKATNVRHGWKMHEIPCIRGMGTDILISEPLHLLKRQDRNTLFRILSAMKSLKYEK